MGKHKLRLSHMIPNAWFYRLQDMNNKPLPYAYSCSTSKQHPLYTKNTINNLPSPKHPLYTQPTEPAEYNHQDFFLTPTSSCYEYSFSESTRSLDIPPSTSCRQITCSTTGLQKLPPILTKPTKSNVDRSTMVEKIEETCSQSSVSIEIVKENISKKDNIMRKPVSEIRIRSNFSKTPEGKRIVDGNNDHKRGKKLSNSCCIVKPSFDPRKDLKESMVEMIMENNIRESKDLEKLLACYLSWNSNEYHEMIIKAFEQISLSCKL